MSFWSATHVIEQEFINNNKVGISPAQIKQNWVNMWAPPVISWFIDPINYSYK